MKRWLLALSFSLFSTTAFADKTPDPPPPPPANPQPTNKCSIGTPAEDGSWVLFGLAGIAYLVTRRRDLAQNQKSV